MSEPTKMRPKKYEIYQVNQPHNCPSMPWIIPIRENVLSAGKRIATLVFDEVGAYEYLGLLLGEKMVVEEIYIPHNQVSNAASVDGGLFHSIEIEDPSLKGYSVLGWIHSHPSATDFLSPTDNQNIELMFATSNNYMENNGAKLKYFYSIVVNRIGEVNAYIDALFDCGSHVRQSVYLNILPGGRVHDESFIRGEIRKKIHFGYRQTEQYVGAVTYVPRSSWEKKVFDRVWGGLSVEEAVTQVGLPQESQKPRKKGDGI